MPTVKTIKPDGTGDFTTLAAWQTFAAAQATADQWAECYGGGNLGAVTLTGWTSTPTSLLYPRIYAAPTARHDGQLAAFPPATAAYVLLTGVGFRIGWSIPYVEIDGLFAYKNVTQTILQANAGGVKFTVKNCLMAHTAGPAGAVFADLNTSNPAPGTVRFFNNIAFAASATTGAGVPAVNVGDSGGADVLYCANNTVIGNGKWTSGISVSCLNAVSQIVGNVVVGINTAAAQVSFLDNQDTGAGEHTAAYSYNASEDGGSTFYGDTHEQTASTASFASATDPTPATGSVLINTGTSTAAYGVTTDVIGTTRPQGAAYDIGAFEVVVSGGSGRRRRHSSSIRL